MTDDGDKLKKQDSASSLDSSRKGMPPKTGGRRGSRRSEKMHESCPVIAESDLNDLLSGSDDGGKGPKKIPESDEESIDSLQGESSRHLTCRRRNDESSNSLHLE